MKSYSVNKISYEETKPFLLEIHYARRMPSISHAFGLFKKDNLCGVITYGTPPSAPLRKGLAGEKNIKNIIELNRLCLKNNKKNEASFFFVFSLKMLPPCIVISFVYTSLYHVLHVY